MGAHGPARGSDVVGARLRTLASRSLPARRRRCGGCAASWPARSRFCGTCGLPLETSVALAARGSVTVVDTRPRITTTAPSRPPHRRLVLKVVAVAAAVVAWSQVNDSLDRLAPTDPAASTVAVDGAVTPQEPAPATGTPATCRRGGDIGAACGPVLVDGRQSRAVVTPLSSEAVVLGVSGEVARVDLPSGHERWRTLAFAGARQLVLHADTDRVLVTSVGAIAAIDADTGDLLWRRDLDPVVTAASGDPRAGERQPDASGPLGPEAPARAWWVGDDVLVLDHLAALHALDGDTGATLWQQSDVGRQAIATPDGVVTARWDLIAAWRPQDPAPTWQHVDQGLRPGTVPHGMQVDGPLPLSPWRRLLDSTTGELHELPSGGPSITYIVGEVTLLLRWPGGDAGLEVTALEAGASVRWQRRGLPVPCCVTTAVRATDGRFVLVSPSAPNLLLDLADGATLATLERERGRLEAVVGDLALWRTVDGLVAEELSGGAEAFRAVGSLLSIDPLLIDGPSGVVAVTTTTTDPALVPSRTDTR